MPLPHCTCVPRLGTRPRRLSCAFVRADMHSRPPRGGRIPGGALPLLNYAEARRPVTTTINFFLNVRVPKYEHSTRPPDTPTHTHQNPVLFPPHLPTGHHDPARSLQFTAVDRSSLQPAPHPPSLPGPPQCARPRRPPHGSVVQVHGHVENANRTAGTDGGRPERPAGDRDGHGRGRGHAGALQPGQPGGVAQSALLPVGRGWQGDRHRAAPPCTRAR